MSKRGKYFPDKESGKNWSDFGVVCLICGIHFHGGLDKGSQECTQHTARVHPGETPRYAGFATALSHDAEKKVRYLSTAREAVNLERILREHGGGWYFYALQYGIAEADDHIRGAMEAEAEGKRPKTLREMVQNGKDA